MVLIPGDRIIHQHETITVAEAYYRGEQVQIISTTGRVLWLRVDQLEPVPTPVLVAR